MASRRSGAVCLALFIALVAAPSVWAEAADSVQGGDPGQENYPWTVIPESLVEIALLRPLGAAATVAGVPMFLASAPFMIPSGEYEWSWDVFVAAPFDYTFKRPFRDF